MILPWRLLRPLVSIPVGIGGVRRQHQTLPVRPQKIAVLGGGLTGLVTAYYLARDMPAGCKITLLERSGRVGGWVQSRKVAVDMAGRKGVVTFESGPRIIKAVKSLYSFDDLVFWELMRDLGLPTFGGKGLRRYIWLRRKASNVAWTLLRHNIRTLFGAMYVIARIFLARFRKDTSRREVADMSVGDGLRTLFAGGEATVEDYYSAVIHGTSGGDINRISLRSMLPVWTEWYANPSIVSGSWPCMLKPQDAALLDALADDVFIRQNAVDAARHSYLALPGGLANLTDGLTAKLGQRPNVVIRKNCLVESVDRDEKTGLISVHVSDGSRQEHLTFDCLVSTLYSKDLAQISARSLPALLSSEAVSMHTVTLWYPREDLVSRHDMGYLIPMGDPDNHEDALGVLFDSNLVPASVSGEPAGTKLCVLMGGHYFGSEPPELTAEEAVARAKRVLARLLGIAIDEPAVAVASGTLRNCIPQKLVGHDARMAAAHHELLHAYAGRLLVAGTSYSGAGLLGSLRAARDVATHLAGTPQPHVGLTGLHGFTNPGIVAGSVKSVRRVRPGAFSFTNSLSLG